MSMSEREKLSAFLFDRNDKEVLNVKFFRGNAKDLTIERLCSAAHRVIADTWNNEGKLSDAPPRSLMPQREVSSL